MLTVPTTVTLSEEQLSRFTGYPVTLPIFEGPLDLLLFLIRRQHIDIYDIPIARITRQFLDYMSLMQSLDVELASEFLVMAATLMEIKSRMLLPRPPALEEEVEEIDPRAELVQRLLEYQQYKAAAEEFREMAIERTRIVTRPDIVPRLPSLSPDPTLSDDVDAFSLWMALQQVLARIEETAPKTREVPRQSMTIRQQMLHIMKLLHAAPAGITFTELFFYEGRTTPVTRSEVIITFLALLELMRLHRLRVRQTGLFGEIRVQAVQEIVRAN